jgi:AraC-like DNA-binding protein
MCLPVAAKIALATAGPTIHARSLAARFPAIRIDTGRLIIGDGDIITAGGVMAWVDLGLNLIERFLSPTVMLETARCFLVDAAGREQRFYSSFAPQLGHGDKRVLQIQHWLQQHAAECPSVAAMATRVSLGKRTFLRRFHKATGMTPTRYLQYLRVGKARESLEFSMSTVNEIAWMVGYEDPGSFRKVFQRIMGLSPGHYRRRFGINKGTAFTAKERVAGSEQIELRPRADGCLHLEVTADTDSLVAIDSAIRKRRGCQESHITRLVGLQRRGLFEVPAGKQSIVCDSRRRVRGPRTLSKAPHVQPPNMGCRYIIARICQISARFRLERIGDSVILASVKRRPEGFVGLPRQGRSGRGGSLCRR